MKKYYAYVLYSDRFNRIYIGHTDCIERRLKQHNLGKVVSTKYYKPYRVIYFEIFSSRIDAVKREKELKKSSNRKLLKKFI